MHLWRSENKITSKSYFIDYLFANLQEVLNYQRLLRLMKMQQFFFLIFFKDLLSQILGTINALLQVTVYHHV